MSKLELDYILHPDWTFYQDHGQFCSNTDTKLLASFMRIKKGDTLLDIGTNNGALLVAADHHPVKHLIGVEVLEDAYKVACINQEKCITHSCEIVHSRIQDFEHDLVDVIVSNPPYFPRKSTNPNVIMTPRQMGRIEENLSLEELIFHSNRLLKSNGRFYMVHRANRLNDIYAACLANSFSLQRIQFAYHKDHAKSVCIEAIKERKCDALILPPVMI